MSTQPKESFDLEAVYDTEIAPLMTKIIDICKQHKLPMFATFLYANEVEGDNGFCTTVVMSEERPIPQPMLDLRNFVERSTPPLRMRVRNKDGQVTEDIVVMP
jgi:hypothetical protein